MELTQARRLYLVALICKMCELKMGHMQSRRLCQADFGIPSTTILGFGKREAKRMAPKCANHGTRLMACIESWSVCFGRADQCGEQKGDKYAARCARESKTS
jgi:hypothetical protein